MDNSKRLDESYWVWRGRANQLVVELTKRLFAENGERRSEELIRWQYLEHLGGAYVAVAHTEAGLLDGAAAIYSAFPVKWRAGGRSVTAAQSFDTLTAEHHRGRGLFVKLASMVYDDMAADNVELVYGVPNELSYGTFISRLRWQSLDPLPFLIRPVGSRYLRVRLGVRHPRIGPASAMTIGDVAVVDRVPDEIDDLSARSECSKLDGVVRDGAYLRWRLRRPGSTYRLFEIRKSGGELMGFSAYELVLKHGAAVGYVLDGMFDQSHPDVGARLLESMLDDLKQRGADIVMAWSGDKSGFTRCLRRKRFVTLPPRFRPIELHLGARSFTAQIPVTRDSLKFSYLDSDTV